MARNLIWACVSVLFLCGCAQMTAEAPLYAAADQVRPAPLTEGVWIFIGDKCPERMARRRGHWPQDCGAMRLSRTPDGAWLISPAEPPRADDDGGDREPMRAIIAPATEHPSTEAFAPLYVVEYAKASETAPQYAVLAPLGDLPARDVFLVIVECNEILREGPIEGVREVRDESGENVRSCIASNQHAVREAARRAAIENIGHVRERRVMFVRP